ncbi:hypothetical protein [Alicyclobacillus fodiniaquatilis]|uniref:Uncharacterized protein n=1 Tax=Alicyclobacillus fodiniaquatilis TaxID=1661150 RepID=A0ABW4JNV0_9BACL
MGQTWRQTRRNFKHAVAGVIFVGLLVGASGTVFTAFAEAISHLGESSAPTAVSAMAPSDATGDTQTNTQSAAGGKADAATGTDGYTPPVMEYSNDPATSTTTMPNPVPASTADDEAPNLDTDGGDSALAAAMDTGGVYVGEHVQQVFGSMLKGLLNTLFVNTN